MNTLTHSVLEANSQQFELFKFAGQADTIGTI